MDRSGEAGKVESFSAKTAICYLLTQLDVDRAFPENISLNPKIPKCFTLYVFASNKTQRKCGRPLYALNYVADPSCLNFQI